MILISLSSEPMYRELKGQRSVMNEEFCVRTIHLPSHFSGFSLALLQKRQIKDNKYTRDDGKAACDCWALFRLPPISIFWHIHIDFRKSGRQMTTIRFLQIRSKPHLEVVWNAIPIRFLQMRRSPDYRAARIQSDGSASQPLSRSRPLLSQQTDCVDDELMGRHFSCFHVGKLCHQRP